MDNIAKDSICKMCGRRERCKIANQVNGVVGRVGRNYRTDIKVVLTQCGQWQHDAEALAAVEGRVE